MATKNERFIDLCACNGFAGMSLEYLNDKGLDRMRAGLFAQGYNIPDNDTMQAQLDVNKFHLWAIALPSQPNGCNFVLYGIGKAGKFPERIPSGGISFIRNAKTDPYQHPGLKVQPHWTYSGVTSERREFPEGYIKHSFSPSVPGRN